MNSETIFLDINEADSKAEDYFIKICGLNRQGEKFNRMKREGLAVREIIRPQLQMRAVLREFLPEEYRCVDANIGSLEIAGQMLDCRAFSRLDFDKIKKAYAYILTCGDFKMDTDSITGLFYADTWGTAYVDSGMDMLYDMIKKRELGQVVTPSFGPGYYGMKTEQVENFFALLPAGLIGVKYQAGGVMIPVKSCTGIYFAVSEAPDLELSACADCSAAKGCHFCEVNTKKG